MAVSYTGLGSISPSTWRYRPLSERRQAYTAGSGGPGSTYDVTESFRLQAPIERMLSYKRSQDLARKRRQRNRGTRASETQKLFFDPRNEGSMFENPLLGTEKKRYKTGRNFSRLQNKVDSVSTILSGNPYRFSL